MTIGELMATVQTMDPDRDVFVALFNPDGTGEVFDIEAVQDHHGDAQLDIYVEAEVFDEEDGNGAVSQERCSGHAKRGGGSRGCLSGLLRAPGYHRRGERSHLECDGIHVL